MFHKNSIRLSAIYLAIIATICLCFSGAVYQLSVQELDRGLRRPGLIVGSGPGGQLLSDESRQQIIQDRELQYQTAKSRIIGRLVSVNLFILVVGGMLSYYFARRTLQPIEAAHEALERFTADASHELRTPITAMRTENEVALLSKNPTSGEVNELLSSNIEELEKLTDLTNGLLQLAHVENHTQLELKEHSAYMLAAKAKDKASKAANKKDISIKLQVPKKLKIKCNDANIVEVLVILLDNAIKYSPKNSTVTVIGRGTKKQVILSVVDEGQGIESTQLPHVFDRFYRADSSRSKNNEKGYGLGLAIAKNIMSVHDGSISIESKVGVGTTVTLTLPN